MAEQTSKKPDWMSDDIGEQLLPQPKRAHRSLHLELKGSLSRRKELLRSVLLEMPEDLKERFRQSISGSFSTGIMILAELKLKELEEAGELLAVDVEEWRGEAADR